MSFKDKPIIKLYEYTNDAFKLVAVIDDYEELSMEHNIYSKGSFSVQINFNIPNSQLFRKNMFLQLGDNADDFFVIMNISDNVGESGKASQIRTITGYDARYIFKRRIINNLNNGSKWEMTGKAENVMIALLNDHCGNNVETKRKLPVIIPISQNRGADYSASESYSNLYDVLENIATQSELGWKIQFVNNQMQLVFYTGTDRTKNVKFSTDMDSLRNGNFTDSLDSYTNAVYVGGKGNNDSKDIYLGEAEIDNEAPSGLDRFEIWDNQSSMTSDEEYSNEAFAKLSQYGQTVNISGQGMIKCPYEFREQYFIGDIINLSFSGKSANVRILSITEHWSWGNYETEFSFGKPIVDLGKQLQLILKKLQSAENEIQSNSTDSVRYYTIPDELVMPKGDVNYRTIGFTGDISDTDKTFQLYFDTNGTGAKTYHVYFKQLSGSGKLVLTTGVEGASNLEFKAGTYVSIIYVDEDGNVKLTIGITDGLTSTTSTWSSEKTKEEIDNKINDNTEENNKTWSSEKITNVMSSLPTDAILHYSFDDVPDLPDGTSGVLLSRNKNWVGGELILVSCTESIVNGNIKLTCDGTSRLVYYLNSQSTLLAGKTVKIKYYGSKATLFIAQEQTPPWIDVFRTLCEVGWNEISFLIPNNVTAPIAFIFENLTSNGDYIEIEQMYVGDSSYNTPIIDNSYGGHNATNNGALSTKGVCGKGIQVLKNSPLETIISCNDNLSVSFWVRIEQFNNELRFVGDWVTENAGHRFIIFQRNDGFYIQWCQNGYAKYKVYQNLPLNQWLHICVNLVDGSGHLFINGVPQGAEEITLFPAGLIPMEKIIFFQSFQGVAFMDDFQIFSRALSEEEIKALYLNKANTPKFVLGGIPTKTSELTNDNFFPSPKIAEACTTDYFLNNIIVEGTNAPACFGSANLTDGPSGNTWYNYLYIPHRTGVGLDNYLYGTLLLFNMVDDTSSMWIRHLVGGGWFNWQQIH